MPQHICKMKEESLELLREVIRTDTVNPPGNEVVLAHK